MDDELISSLIGTVVSVILGGTFVFVLTWVLNQIA